ncbi:hypothetical protein EON65_41630 [archaeon]|nr:MAG: hypothetical protein EON65_41630 [archaeon]
MERAYALRDAREKARQVYVQKRLQDQWRDACDDARTLDSKAALLYMNQERLRQIQEKKDKKQQLSKQEDNFLEEWNRQLDAMERRDREKHEHHHQMEVANSAAIMKQIQDNERMKEEHYWKTMQEDESELSRLRQEIEDEERLQRQKALEARQRGKEVCV